MTRRLCAFVIVSAFVFPAAGPALAAQSAWICQMGKNPVRFEIRRHTLRGFENPYSAQPVEYDITADTARALTAERKISRTRHVTFTIDKRTRRFRQMLVVKHGDSKEQHSGYCAAFARKR